MENQKKINWFYKLLIILFIIFLCLYSISMNGYMANINKNKTLYTEEQIKKFEDDIKNGKEVDLENYMENKDKNYANKVSDFGVIISDSISYAANKTIELINRLFSYLFE